MTGQRRLDPRELGDDAPAEIDDALSSAVWLESAVGDVPIRASAGFADRVMAALEHEPTPAAAGFLSPVRRHGFVAGFADSLRQAWGSAFSGGRPAMVRASALAYVLAVVLAGTALAGVATVGVGSALGIIGPTATQTTAPPTPRPTGLDQPSGLNEPSGLEPPETTEPDGSEDPGESDGAGSTDDHGGSPGPDESDDHGGDGGAAPTGPSSSGSDDHSDDHGTGTPGPSGTPRTTGTPKPSQTSGSGGDG